MCTLGVKYTHIFLFTEQKAICLPSNKRIPFRTEYVSLVKIIDLLMMPVEKSTGI